MDSGTVIGVLGAVGALVSVVLTAVTLYLTGRQKRRAEEQKVLAEEQNRRQEQIDATVARQEKIIDRLERHVGQQQVVIDQLTEEHTACTANLAQMHAWLLRFRDAAVRLCRDAGRDPDKELPELPPAPPPPSGAAEFRQRTARHNTGLIRDAAAGPRAAGDTEGEAP